MTFCCHLRDRIAAVLLLLGICVSGCAGSGNGAEGVPDDAEIALTEADEGQVQEPSGRDFAVTLLESLPDGEWQRAVSFPDAYGTVDNSLAINSMVSFRAYRGQGTCYIRARNGVESYQLFLNGTQIDTARIRGGFVYQLDLSAATVNGSNTLQISGISPAVPDNTVDVWIPYPVIVKVSPEEAGIRPETLNFIDRVITSDVSYGFPAAQLAVIKDGKIVYENAWGSTCAEHPLVNGETVRVPVTTETLFDLASVSKMFGVNYALQKMVTDGELDLDTQLAEILGEAFVDHTEERAGTDAETMEVWKRSVTLRDVLHHSAGFPEDPRSFGFYYETILSTDDRDTIIDALYAVPLVYEPGTDTRYSDMDYMLLGLVVEELTGKDLDTYLKETFCTPLGLSHITYNPLNHGFPKEQIAATTFTGNTLDGRVKRDGLRTYTLQGEVHDENAYHGFQGVAGHAGLFANATDLALLASLMLDGGHGDIRFFSTDVIDAFTAARSEKEAYWGLGWWREADNGRLWYFGTGASPDAFGHQGWTGVMVTIDPENNLVIVYLTNRCNSPVLQDKDSPYLFSASCFTAASPGFVPQVLSIGMDGTGQEDIDAQLFSLLVSMTDDAFRMIPEDASEERLEPLLGNAESKLDVLESFAADNGRENWMEQAKSLRERYNR